MNQTRKPRRRRAGLGEEASLVDESTRIGANESKASGVASGNSLRRNPRFPLTYCGWVSVQDRSIIRTFKPAKDLRDTFASRLLTSGIQLGYVSKPQVYLGDAGLYLAGAIAGLTDVDAISLSMAQLARTDAAQIDPASRTIVIAVAANTLFKAGMVAFLGAPGLRRIIVVAAGAILVAAALAALLL